MDNREAERILDEQLANYVERGFDMLAGLVAARSVETKEALGSSGAQYQIEIICVWDDQPGGAIRILGSIDDGGLRALVPLSRSVLVWRP